MLCGEGFGFDSGLFGGLLEGRVELGLKLGYSVQKKHRCTPGKHSPFLHGNKIVSVYEAVDSVCGWGVFMVRCTGQTSWGVVPKGEGVVLRGLSLLFAHDVCIL